MSPLRCLLRAGSLENLPLASWADSGERRLSRSSSRRAPACTCPPAPAPRPRPAELRALRDPARPLVALGREVPATVRPAARVPQCSVPRSRRVPFRGALVGGPSPCMRSIGEALRGLPRERAAVPESGRPEGTSSSRRPGSALPVPAGTGLTSGAFEAPTPLFFSLARC